MRILLAVLILISGIAVGAAVEEKKPSAAHKKKQTQMYNLPEVGDEVVVANKAKKKQSPKQSKWEGPEFDAAKNEAKKKKSK